MEQEFDAIIQDRDGWSGMRDLLTSWLTYATSREWRSTLRIHRSPHLRRILEEFTLNEQGVWTEIERNTALDRALLYVPWRNESYQMIYRVARRYLFPTGTAFARMIGQEQVQIMIQNEENFNWQITAYIL